MRKNRSTELVMTQAVYVLLAGLAVSGLVPLEHVAGAYPLFVPSNERRVVNQAIQHRNFTMKEPSKKENPEVDKAVGLLIDTMFKERKVEEAFEQYFRLSPLSPEERSALSQIDCDPSDEISRYKDARTTARALAVGWNYAYQPVLLALGTTSLSSGDVFRKSFEQAQVAIDEEREKILSKRGISKDEFYTLLDLKAVKDQSTLEHHLTTLELINADIAHFIERKTNKNIYARNVTEMEKDYIIKPHGSGDHVLYEVGLKPMFKIVFMRQGDTLKMVSFGDVL